MKLIRIVGKIWELTCLQDDRYAGSSNITVDEANYLTICGLGWGNGTVRVLADNGIKSKAIAIIETEVNGYPRQMKYEIYHNSKGFFCKIKGKRVFLKDIIAR